MLVTKRRSAIDRLRDQRGAEAERSAIAWPSRQSWGLGTVAAILMFIGLAMIWSLLRRARRIGLVPALEAA